MYEKVTLEELIKITKDFIALADRLLGMGKITTEEYHELTHVKKGFLREAEANV